MLKYLIIHFDVLILIGTLQHNVITGYKKKYNIKLKLRKKKDFVMIMIIIEKKMTNWRFFLEGANFQDASKFSPHPKYFQNKIGKINKTSPKKPIKKA